MLETWKQKEKRFAMKWGMNNLEDMPNRPSFHPLRNPRVKKDKSYINGKDYHYFDPWAAKRISCQSRFTVFLMILTVIVGIVAILAYKIVNQGNEEATLFASLLHSCFIVGMDMFSRFSL